VFLDCRVGQQLLELSVWPTATSRHPQQTIEELASRGLHRHQGPSADKKPTRS
jgi:hypothetical protein